VSFPPRHRYNEPPALLLHLLEPFRDHPLFLFFLFFVCLLFVPFSFFFLSPPCYQKTMDQQTATNMDMDDTGGLPSSLSSSSSLSFSTSGIPALSLDLDLDVPKAKEVSSSSDSGQFQTPFAQRPREMDLEECRVLFNQLQYNLNKQFECLQYERQSLAKERAIIEQKRQAFEEVKKTMTNVLQLQESRIKLNVGGCKFTTSLDTLLIYPESMLGSMFSGKYKIEKDEKGYFFIDRDGTHFRYILNFLRSGTLLMPEDPVVKRELLVEAEFYQIKPLIDLIMHGPQKEVRFSRELVHKNITLDSTRTIATVSTKGTCRVIVDTPSISTGKNFWEFRLDKLQNPNCIAIGVTRTTGNLSAYVGSSKDGWSLIVMNRENMKKWNSPTCEEYGTGVFKEGDTVGMLLDYTNGERGTLSFYLNGTNQGEAFRNLPPHLFPTVSLHSKGDQVSLLPSRVPEDA
jgi:hypothetical protein